MAYRYDKISNIIRESDGACIPPDPSNSDYASLIASGEEILPYEVDMSAERTQAQSTLSAAVSAIRAKYAGAITSQDLIYNMKLAEAQAYVSAGRPADTSPFTVLVASAEGRGKSVSDEADAVIATAQAWITLGAESERLRLAGQKAISEAQTLEAIYGARDEYVGRLGEF